MNTFADRLSYEIECSGKTQNQISSELRITKQKLSKLKNGNVEPCLDDLILLANYFNVSTDYLLGREEDGISAGDPTREPDVMVMRLIYAYSKLSPEKRLGLLAFLGVDVDKHPK